LKISLPVFQDLALGISDEPDGHSRYPTARLQKGLVMHYRGLDLTEEAVGFGVPVLKCGLLAVFPGAVELELLQGEPAWKVSAVYSLNLVEKVGRVNSTTLKSKAFYHIKDSLAALIRHIPALRAPLTASSSAARRVFNWETRYEAAQGKYEVRLVYTLDTAKGSLLVETGDVPLPAAVTELIIMNEQGAHSFDQYQDSTGVCLSGKAIGCWDEVLADRASFASSIQGLRFTLPKAAGARLFRGRELIGSRLAWAGFGYTLSHPSNRFEYSLRLEKVP